MKIKLQCIALLVFIVNTSIIWAQSSERELKRELESIQKEIKSEKDRWTHERERISLFKQQASKRLRDSEQQLRLVKLQSDSLKVEVKNLNSRNKKIANSSKYYINKRKKYATALAKEIDLISAHISSGFPFEAEGHSEALKSTASGLRSGVIPPEEGLSRAWAVLLARVSKGFESEVYSGTLSVESGELSGTFLRLGQVLLLFKDNDGNQLKYLVRKGASFEWLQVPEDMEVRRKFKEIFDVMQGKIPPQLVQVPVVAHEALEVK